MGYSDAEKQEFRNKDLRISKLAITKSVIEKSEDIYDVEKVVGLVEKYIDYVYEERQRQSESSAKRGQVNCVVDSTEPIGWEQIAKGLNLATPNATNIKILNQVVDEYKKANKASANPSDILVQILNVFGKYPTKTESVEKIVKVI